MAVNKNFVVKQGLEVKQNLLVAEGSTSRIGIGTTAPLYTTHVIGGIGATDLYVSGVSTFSGAIDANGALDVDGHTELDDVNVSGASTFTGIGTFASDLYVGGNLNVDGDIVYDEATARNWNVSGIATAVKLHVGVDTGFFNEKLVVNGDARITGILTIGTASITLDPNAKTLTGLEELKIGSGSTAITIKKSETTGEIEFADESGRETSVGIGTTVSINTTGIITASSMVVSGTTGAFYPPVLNTTQRDALTVTQGAMIFNTSTSKIEFYDGSSWNSVPGVTLGLGMGVF